MRDRPKEIDFDDLCSEKKQKVRRLKRIIISLWDLERAASYAEQILSDYANESGETSEKHFALDLALRVSYSRPFSRNRRGEDGDVAPRLYEYDQPPPVYDDCEISLHEEVYDSRNEVYAHSDPKSYDLDVWVKQNGISTLSETPHLRTLSRQEIDMLKKMIAKLHKHLRHEKHDIAEELESGEY